MAAFILTSKGKRFDFTKPDEHHFDIEEIAHALSHLCRYTGHCKHFYSVAQHSVLVSLYLPAEQALSGLLHDASEAYLGDVASPLKALLPDYKAIEKAVEAAICKQYHLPFPLPEIVKNVDLRALVTEARYLFEERDRAEVLASFPNVPELHVPKSMFSPLDPAAAKDMFLWRWQCLTKV